MKQTYQEKLAILHDTIIGLRILLDHAARHCDCAQCQAIKKKFSMEKHCPEEAFKLPEVLS